MPKVRMTNETNWSGEIVHVYEDDTVVIRWNWKSGGWHMAEYTPEDIAKWGIIVEVQEQHTEDVERRTA